MGYCQSPISSSSSHRLGGYYTICLCLLLVLVLSSGNSQRFMAEGRAMNSKTVSVSNEVEESNSMNKAMILRGQIGSRPPRCKRRCGTCGPCEAIQVPTSPQLKPANTNSSPPAAASHHLAYARGDFSSEYKPMSWKCKCGGLIFDP